MYRLGEVEISFEQPFNPFNLNCLKELNETKNYRSKISANSKIEK